MYGPGDVAICCSKLPDNVSVLICTIKTEPGRLTFNTPLAVPEIAGISDWFVNKIRQKEIFLRAVTYPGNSYGRMDDYLFDFRHGMYVFG